MSLLGKLFPAGRARPYASDPAEKLLRAISSYLTIKAYYYDPSNSRVDQTSLSPASEAMHLSEYFGLITFTYIDMT